MPSRSPFAFQRRCQKRPLNWPSPRVATDELLVHQYPPLTDKPLSELDIGEGAPPPDRVVFNSWTPPADAEE